MGKLRQVMAAARQGAAWLVSAGRRDWAGADAARLAIQAGPTDN